jgi:hypothetical protein
MYNNRSNIFKMDYKKELRYAFLEYIFIGIIMFSITMAILILMAVLITMK